MAHTVYEPYTAVMITRMPSGRVQFTYFKTLTDAEKYKEEFKETIINIGGAESLKIMRVTVQED